jgi:hypothetical protein
VPSPVTSGCRQFGRVPEVIVPSAEPSRYSVSAKMRKNRPRRSSAFRGGDRGSRTAILRTATGIRRSGRIARSRTGWRFPSPFSCQGSYRAAPAVRDASGAEQAPHARVFRGDLDRKLDASRVSGPYRTKVLATRRERVTYSMQTPNGDGCADPAADDLGSRNSLDHAPEAARLCASLDTTRGFLPSVAESAGGPDRRSIHFRQK